jgi:hypothetical protein
MTWHDGQKVISVTDISEKIDRFFNEVVVPLYKIKSKVASKFESREICNELDKVIEKLNQLNPQQDSFDEDIKDCFLRVTDGELIGFFNKDIEDIKQILNTVKIEMLKDVKNWSGLNEKIDLKADITYSFPQPMAERLINEGLAQEIPLESSLREIFEDRIRIASRPDFLKSSVQREREFLVNNINTKFRLLQNKEKEEMASLFDTLREGLIADLRNLKTMVPNYELEYRQKHKEFYKEMRQKIRLEKRKRGQPPKRFNVLVFHLGNQFTFVRYNRKGKAVGWARRDWELMAFVLLLIHFTRYEITEIKAFLKEYRRESEKETWKRFRDMVKKGYNNFLRSGKGKFGKNFHRYMKAERYGDQLLALNPHFDYPK